MPTFPVKGKPLSNWLQELFDKPCDTNKGTKKTNESTERAKK